jgi:hypothetical protein
VLPPQIEYWFIPNDGVMFGFTVTVNVAGNAHWPAVGVKVYVPEALLLTTDGLHVPVIPFVDVVGKLGTAPPAQIVDEVPKLNVGYHVRRYSYCKRSRQCTLTGCWCECVRTRSITIND